MCRSARSSRRREGRSDGIYGQPNDGRPPVGKAAGQQSRSIRSATSKDDILTIEHAIVRTKPKPWGSTDLRPWSRASTGDGPIGELWFERPDLPQGLAKSPAVPETALLLKLLFTTEPL